jgi:hypothetical protein
VLVGVGTDDNLILKCISRYTGRTAHRLTLINHVVERTVRRAVGGRSKLPVIDIIVRIGIDNVITTIDRGAGRE